MLRKLQYPAAIVIKKSQVATEQNHSSIITGLHISGFYAAAEYILDFDFSAG